MIFVDDGSQDGSWEVIARLAAEDPRVRGHPVPPQFRQGGRAQRRLRRRPGASWS